MTSRFIAPLLGVLAALVLACGNGGGHAAAPKLESLTIGTGQTYASVGAPQQLTVTAHYSDGSSSQVGSGLAWATSADAVATVDASGVVTPWSEGTADVTATHAESGLSAKTTITSRVLVSLRAASALPAGASVSTAKTYFHVAGLRPGAMYRPTVQNMTDDVDLEVYADESMSDGSLVCGSYYVGRLTDSCVAPASAAGDLWIAVTGEWTQRGAWFSLDVPVAAEMALAGELAFPAALPYAGSVGVTKQFWKVTGLAPGKPYEFRISNLTADVDLEIYGDAYEYRSLCESYLDGTADDACTATAPEGGALIVELDGMTSLAGGSYSLSVTAK